MGKVLKSAVAVLPGAIIAGLAAGTGTGWAVFGASLFAGTAAGLLMKPPKMDLAEHGTNLRLKTDPAAPRQLIYGRVATGGTLVYRETAGTDNKNLHLVIALATHEIESVDGMDWAGEAVTFSGSNAVGQFANKMYLTPHMGAEDQLADSDLVSDCAQWTSAHRLRGLAYVHLKLIYDTEVYKQGLQQVRFFVKGRKIYDPRLDGENGGTGAHRLADTTTWEWSDNPALIAADYLMGFSLNGKQVAGMGVDPARIDWTSVSAQANICDEPVTLKSTDTEKRYTCNGIINSSRRHGDNLGQISSAMGGNIVFQSGKWRLFAAASRPAVLGRDKQNIIGGIALTAQKGWSEKVNAIRGVYPDADVSYEAKDYPPIVDASFVTADGGQELWMDLSLPMTTSKTMAQRLAKIALRRARMEKKTTLTLTPDALQDQCMDAVNLTYLPFNIDGQKMLVADWALKFDADKDGNVGILCTETLVQEDDSIYDWDEDTDEQDVLTPTKANPLALSSWKGSDLKYDGGVTFESLKPSEIGSTYGAFSGSGGTLRDEFGFNFTDFDIRTSLGTSEDLNWDGGYTKATIKSYADTGYQLSQPGTSYKIHADSVTGIDLNAGNVGGTGMSSVKTNAQTGYDLTQNNSTEIDNSSLPDNPSFAGSGDFAAPVTVTSGDPFQYECMRTGASSNWGVGITFDTDYAGFNKLSFLGVGDGGSNGFQWSNIEGTTDKLATLDVNGDFWVKRDLEAEGKSHAFGATLHTNRYSDWVNVQIGGGGIFSDVGADNVLISSNVRQVADGSWTHTATDYGSMFQLVNGSFNFFTCPSKTAGSTASYNIISTLSRTGIFSATDFTATSRRKWKKNVKAIKGARVAMDEFFPVWHEWRKNFRGYTEDQVPIAGYILEDCPAWVVSGDGVKYQKIVPVLDASLKELWAENDTLKADVETLKRQVSALLNGRA
jgi:hypothetical protein